MEVERTTLFIGAAVMEGMLWELTKEAYQKGQEGAAGYPLDVDTEIAAMEDFAGKKLRPIGYKPVADIVKKLNQAYDLGCKERTT